MLKNLFGLCAGENIGNLVLEAEEKVPPYPNIPHFFVLQSKGNRDYYQQDTYKLFELAALHGSFVMLKAIINRKRVYGILKYLFDVIAVECKCPGQKSQASFN
jgi:hypothetical protein